MKKCDRCGFENDDNEVCCCDCGGTEFKATTASPAKSQTKSTQGTVAASSKNASPPPVPPQISEDGRYRRYEDVPWYRREPGGLAFLGVIFCGVVSIALCVICLTGDVYKNAYDKDGNLKVWGVGNKIAAVLILALQVYLYWVYHQLGRK
jgi:hypothetical protein